MPLLQAAKSATQPRHWGARDDGDGAETRRWSAIADNLVLLPAQRLSLLEMRQCQHVRLAELEAVRKELCMQVRHTYTTLHVPGIFDCNAYCQVVTHEHFDCGWLRSTWSFLPTALPRILSCQRLDLQLTLQPNLGV